MFISFVLLVWIRNFKIKIIIGDLGIFTLISTTTENQDSDTENIL